MKGLLSHGQIKICENHVLNGKMIGYTPTIWQYHESYTQVRMETSPPPHPGANTIKRKPQFLVPTL